MVTVSSWADFVSAVATAGETVSISLDTVWDMNEIAPLGAGTVDIYCDKIIGNNAVIKSPNVTSNFLVFHNPCTVSRLNIDTFQASANVVYTDATVEFGKCGFSGLCITDAAFAYNNTGSIIFGLDEPQYAGEGELGCNFNIVAANGAQLAQGRYNGNVRLFRYANIHFAGTSMTGWNLSTTESISLYDSYVSGEVGMLYFHSCERTILNARGTVGKNSYGNRAKNSLCNTDRATIDASYTSALIPVTGEQLADVAYLQSVGFPIGG